MYWAIGIAKSLQVSWPDFPSFDEIDSGETIDSLENEEYETTSITDELEEETAHKLSISSKEPSKKIIKLKRNKNGNLFVTITKESVQLWVFRVIINDD